MVVRPVVAVCTLPGLWSWSEWAPVKSVLDGVDLQYAGGGARSFNKVYAPVLHKREPTTAVGTKAPQ